MVKRICPLKMICYRMHSPETHAQHVMGPVIKEIKIMRHVDMNYFLSESEMEILKGKNKSSSNSKKKKNPL